MMYSFFLVLSGLSLFLPFETPLSEPTFYLEQIEVNGNRLTTENLIIQQSLLESAQSYSEQELSLAMARINRLPFVLDTYFTLEKGEGSRTFRLIIQVKESQRVFLDFDTGYISRRNSPNDYGFDSLNVGIRHFLTSNFMVFGGYRPKATLSNERNERESFALGLTYFNLFKAGSSLSILADIGDATLFPRFPRDDQTATNFESELYQLNYSMPLTGNHRLVTIANYGDNQLRTPAPAGVTPTILNWFRIQNSESTSRSVQSYWEWSSVDDNFVPSSGFRLQGGVFYGKNETESDRFLPNNDSFELSDQKTTQNTRNIGVNLHYDHYWDFKDRHVLFFNVGATVAWRKGNSQNVPLLIFPRELDDPLEFEFRDTTFDSRWHKIDLSVGYALKLWNKQFRDRYGDLRLEFKLSDGYLRFDSDSQVFRRDSQINLNSRFGENQRSQAIIDGRNEDNTVLDMGLKYRNEWGVLRASLRYDLDH